MERLAANRLENILLVWTTDPFLHSDIGNGCNKSHLHYLQTDSSLEYMMNKNKTAHAAKVKRWEVQQEGKSSATLFLFTIAIKQME